MPLEKGGRADKLGNRYEIKCIVYEMLKVINEKIYSVTIEALGDDECGTDILVHKKNGEKEHQQCKVRNGSREYWTLYDLQSRGVIDAWKFQLNRDNNRSVTMVSPIGCSLLVDLHNRAMNTNENTEKFYDVQVKNSSRKFVMFYEDLCAQMGLDYTNNLDVKKSVELLKRINFYQISEHFLYDSIFGMIDYYFSSDNHVVYNALVSFIVDGDVLGKEITAVVLLEYLEAQHIRMRLLDGDNRIVPQIKRINEEFRSNYFPIHGELFDRSEFKECIKVIEQEENLIITGKAGYGKSGCVEAVLNYCEEKRIPHIAIKVDRRKPHGNCDTWGKNLGFSGSFVYALHAISENEQAVVLLDQLDALRWTQANSSEALIVCMELVKQISRLNEDRNKKISIVFVCRSYDLINDNRIKALFEPNERGTYKNIIWKKVVVQMFDESIVSKIVGEKYKLLPTKTKTLLRVPSNLYMWQHLDGRGDYYECITTSHLIEKWFEQICKRGMTDGISEQLLIETRNEIVNMADKLGRLFIPKNILKCGQSGLDYLISSEILINEGNKIGFAHQSILDYYISNQMIEKYYDGICIEKIIGEKTKQSPGRRYQVQMFMQSLFEYDCNDFLRAGKELIECDKIRYYIKFVFYELLSQIENPSEAVIEFVTDYCDHGTYGEFLFNNVFYGHKQYISVLMERGILDRWLEDTEKKERVFALLRSISEDLGIKDVEFIKKYAFKNKGDDEQFLSCFNYDIYEDSDELFDLRLHFYEEYPEWSARLYIDVKKTFEVCENRVIDIVAFWLNKGLCVRKENLYTSGILFDDDKDSFSVKNGQYIIEKLLEYIPIGDSWEIKYSNWAGCNTHGKSIERFVVEIIKKANENIIDKDPNLFWYYYEPYIGKGHIVFNEIILEGLKFLPESESNSVIDYFCTDIDKRVFDDTSNANNRLKLTMNVIERHSKFCDEKHLIALENAVQKYVSPKAVEWYKERIEYNKSNFGEIVYWSFWGELQYQLLQSIPYERLSKGSKELLKVLNRRFGEKADRYSRSYGHSGTVMSPVSRKRIGKKQWLQILTNKKLETRNHASWKEVDGGFIESSLEMYASDFRSAVSLDPNGMIQLVLENKENILPIFIGPMFSGAEFSEKINTVNRETWEDMFRCFPCDIDSQRMSYFCGIIEKAKIYDWSKDVISQLIDIAVNYQGDNRNIEEINEMNSEDLVSASLNCVRGSATRAIGHELWGKPDLLNEFKDTIELLSFDDNSAIKMASMFALWPSYNIDRNWAEIQILRLYESDIRMAAYSDSKKMFNLLYPRYRERILEVVYKCFYSKDKRLTEIGGNSICEFYVLHDEFFDVISDYENFDEMQVKSILHMAILYLKQEEHREKAKTIILSLKNTEIDVEFPLSMMFYDNLVDVNRDSEFLIEIVKANVNRGTIYAFVHYLEENASSVKEYAYIILSLCENILSQDSEKISSMWGVENNISKLIIALYDECVDSSAQNDKDIAEKCLDFWDIMFEKQIGQVRRLSRELMER